MKCYCFILLAGLLLSSCKKEKVYHPLPAPPDDTTHIDQVDFLIGKYNCQGTQVIITTDKLSNQINYGQSKVETKATISKIGRDSFHVKIDKYLDRKFAFEKSNVYIIANIHNHESITFYPAKEEFRYMYTKNGGARTISIRDTLRITGVLEK